jgi:hypothetical protein
MAKIKRILFSKSFIGAILFAFALWTYASLRVDSIQRIKVPLKIILPKNRAIDSAVISTVAVELKASGWKLFNLMFINKSALCEIDLSDQTSPDYIIEVPRSEIIKSLQFSTNVQPLNVFPDRIVLKTTNIGENKVPLKPQLKIIPSEDFTIVNTLKLSPDSVLIRGNERIVNNIISWPTKYLEVNNINRSFAMILPLSDTLKNMVSVSENSTKVEVEIQQKCSITLPTVEIQIRGGRLAGNEHLYPEFVNVTLEGGIDKIVSLSAENVKASIEYSDILSDSTGILIPHLVVPENIKILRVDPPYIYYKKRIKKF